jgi:hypothetical protein
MTGPVGWVRAISVVVILLDALVHGDWPSRWCLRPTVRAEIHRLTGGRRLLRASRAEHHANGFGVDDLDVISGELR